MGYKKKCCKCGKFTLTKDMIRGFGTDKCKACASIRKINRNAIINLPMFLLKKKGIEVGDHVKFKVTKEGILMKKHGK